MNNTNLMGDTRQLLADAQMIVASLPDGPKDSTETLMVAMIYCQSAVALQLNAIANSLLVFNSTGVAALDLIATELKRANDMKALEVERQESADNLRLMVDLYGGGE